MSELKYKKVNGELVPLTQEEIEQFERDAATLPRPPWEQPQPRDTVTELRTLREQIDRLMKDRR